MDIRFATALDIPALSALQAKYLVVNLSAEEKLEGFVTTPFTEKQMLEVIANEGLFVAFDGETLAGYIYVGSWDYYDQWPIFPVMNGRFPKLQFMGMPITRQNSFQYGPICIDAAYRGTGLVKRIFEYMRIQWQHKYPIAGTFINRVNKKSIHVHTTKLNWEIIDEFSFNGNEYYTLAFDMTNSIV
jgi:hypothetical protein